MVTTEGEVLEDTAVEAKNHFQTLENETLGHPRQQQEAEGQSSRDCDTKACNNKKSDSCVGKKPMYVTRETHELTSHPFCPPGNLFVQYNAQHLSRIYPLGLKLNSSNYNPQEMWNAGCQLVALNFQTPGVEMDLNEGRFLVNGRCGYVLKPAFLRSSQSTFDPEGLGCRTDQHSVVLTIKVITAQQLPKLNKEKNSSIVDPFVRVEIHGVSVDCCKKQTAYQLNNGFNPCWNETLTFQVEVPELALVRFVVEDYDTTSSNDFVGQFTLPLPSLREGYRHIHLLSKDGTSLSPATLFVHVRCRKV
ncbi:1-phosphatidylinositol 4,5-bisphosphate phosphodiesterase delta-3 [Varanus komodoensis]|nr:1-phosphatidylinositol 4,5-bisphosphate phosphodiesterase delta-3 [Varanus komodoensis]